MRRKSENKKVNSGGSKNVPDRFAREIGALGLKYADAEDEDDAIFPTIDFAEEATFDNELKKRLLPLCLFPVSF